MSDQKHDPIVNAIYKGIKEDIEFNETNKRWRATLILIFAGIDAMAFLNMPVAQTDVTRADFIGWTERYLNFPGGAKLRGLELYGARCGLLHTYTSESRMSRTGSCKQLIFVDKIPGSPIRETKRPEYIAVSIAALKAALFEAIDVFLVDLFDSPAKAKAAEMRLNKLLITREDFPGSHLGQMFK